MGGSLIQPSSVNKIDSNAQQTVSDKQSKARAKLRFCVNAISVLLLLAAIVCLAAGFIHGRSKNSSEDTPPPGSQLSYGSKAILAACNSTLYPEVCEQDLKSDPASHNASSTQLALIGVRAALAHVQDAHKMANSLVSNESSTAMDQGAMESAALQDCIELLDGSIDHLNDSMSQLSSLTLSALRAQFANVKIQLSTSLSYLAACGDGFSHSSGKITQLMLSEQQAVSQSVANSLYLVDAISKLAQDASHVKDLLHFRRRLLITPPSNDMMKEGVPAWISPKDRKLLEAGDETYDSPLPYDAIVAQDGSGNFTRVQAAVDEAPRNSNQRYIVFVKAGIYKEYVRIPSNLWNIMLLGEGINKTIITGSRSFALQNYTTYESATVAISGKGFIAKDMSFRNTAGPEGHQAVAVRAGADLVIFVSCAMEGYQDTLYALSSRQFYKGCSISGTIDFIFGNAAAAFQDCVLLARRPLQGQQNTYTAQGREIDADPTGFSFQNCTLIASHDLSSSPYAVENYLGRPWKQFSRTVFMASYLGDLINPAGWLPWNASNPFIKTIYYGEYVNTGPGSGTKERVDWAGVHSSLSSHEAQALSLENLFMETSWLGDAGVEFEQDV